MRASSAARDGKAAAGAPRASYTFAEVAAHNTAESCWVTMDGRVYDLTGFLDDHPGGKEMLLLAAGRECTDLFRMYHWRVAGANGKGHVERQMQAHEIGVLAGPTQHPVFAPDTVGLYDELSVAVKKYFTESGATPKQCAWPERARELSEGAMSEECCAQRALASATILTVDVPLAPTRPARFPARPSAAQCGRASGASRCSLSSAWRPSP